MWASSNQSPTISSATVLTLNGNLFLFFPWLTTCSPTLVESAEAPKLQKRYVLVIGVVVLVCAATGIAQICHQLAGRPRGLDPPDPEVPLPPSPSIERRFTRAAVCSDAMACSAVGRGLRGIISSHSQSEYNFLLNCACAAVKL
uniref:Uncharacterized protein n=1 Tax=Timema tahoe TaxID=61484 RepID=A0A7R9NZ10_9NEOP|nr:unnamed protein product [Timema tahoe]